MKNILEIEISLLENLVDKDLIESIKETVRIKLNEWKPFNFGSVISKFRSPFLDDYVESIRVCLPEESGEEMEQCNVHQNLNDSVVDLTTLRYYFFSLNKEGSNSEEFATDDNEGQAVKAALHWTLPSAEFEGLWESLCLEPGLKEKLLSYVSTMLLLSDRGVDSNIITCNRVVLLHGPPGTGKTTLCKALAHKLAIRMADRYSAGAFLEINTHSLFSKWFSESGKLVTQMFTLIRETIARNRDVLTCILIDEVESLTHIRQASESEPSDAIRVVNAVLTQIDQIRGYPNVLILTTSNLTGSIDGAFLDRADINQYIGPPTQTAIYQIFLSCLKELMKAKLINNECLFPVDLLKYPEAQSGLSLHLKQIAGQSVGLSGRTLRKIPLLAFTKCHQAPPLELKNFLDAMEAVILENKNLRNQNGPFEGSKEVKLESS